MPISNSYPKGIPVEDQDLFVGTKAYNNRTVNYTAQGVADYLNINSKVSIGGQMSFQFVTVPSVAKTIAFDGGGGNNTLFSAITQLVVSAIDVSTANITIFLNYLNNSQVLLSEQNQPNFFGHYKITGYTQIGITDFYTLDLEYIGGNGTIIDKQYYDLISFVLTSGSGTTPNLQEVTDEGNTTTNNISVDGGSNNGIELFSFGAVNIKDGANSNYIDSQNITFNDGVYNQTISRANLTDNSSISYPDASGIIALTTDITTPTLQEVTDEGNITTNPIILEDAGLQVEIGSNVGFPYFKMLNIESGQATFFDNSDNTDSRYAKFQNKDGTLAYLDDIPTTSGFVPYTGATTDLDLGTYNLTAGHINLNVSPSGAGFVVGSTQWNNDLGSSQTLLKGGSVTLKNGVDLVARVVNKVVPNTTLTKAAYQVVRVAGAQGQRLAINLAQANTDLNSADTLGVVTETITTNQEGFILTVGQLLDINTTGSLQGETWADGDVLYLSPTVAGRMTNIKPNGATGHVVVLGYVEYAHANNGKIYVKIMNGWELDELHNVFISNPLNNQVLSYNSATDLWVNRNVSEFNDLQVRRNGFILFDDLLTIANGTSPFIKGTLSSGQILASGNTQNNPGVITINCSATANSGAYVAYVNSATATSSFLSNNMGFDAIVSLGSVPVANTTIRAGLIRGTMTSADATEGCYFEIINTGIVGKTAMGGVRSSTVSFTLAANTFYHLRIIYNSTTLNTFQVYNMSGSLLFSATLSTNISTGVNAIQPTFLATSTIGAATTIALLDYIAVEYPSYNRGALT